MTIIHNHLVFFHKTNPAIRLIFAPTKNNYQNLTPTIMKTKNLLFGVLLIVFSACTTTKVVSDYNEKFDFNNVQTYKIVIDENTHNSNVMINDLNRARIESSINNQMNNRGLTESETPDVYVYYNMGVEHKKNYSTSSSYYSPHYGRRGYGGGYGHGHSSTQEYTTTDGNLTISIHCPVSDELLWYGAGVKSIDGKSKKKDQELDKAIDKIMDELPIMKLEELASE